MTVQRRPVTLEERIVGWVSLGADSATARWHAALAAALEAWGAHLVAGRIVTSAALAPEEARSFAFLCRELDLPPDSAGVFLPPALSGHFEPASQGARLRRAPGAISRLVLLQSALHPQRLLVAELACDENAPGADVFEKGCCIASRRFTEDPAAGLSDLAWRYLGGADLSRAACRRYTEWWFRRCAAAGRSDLPLHPELSYLHHPERLEIDAAEAALRLSEAVLAEVCEPLADPEKSPAAVNGMALVEAVEARLMGLLDLVRRSGAVDFGALQGQAEARFKEGFNRAVGRTCRRLAGR